MGRGGCRPPSRCQCLAGPLGEDGHHQEFAQQLAACQRTLDLVEIEFLDYGFTVKP